MNRNWYAVYTKPQCETKVVALLSKKKIENFCPHKRMFVGYGNKRKMVYEPLFPSYVFVLITEIQMFEVLKTADVINFVYWLGKPAIIKTVEIENIASFNGAHYNIQVERSPVNASGIVKITNEKVLISNTPGIMPTHTNRATLTLPSLGYKLYGDMPMEEVTAQAQTTRYNASVAGELV